VLACGALFGLARALVSIPHIDAAWRVDPQGQVQLQASTDPALAAHAGASLVSVTGGNITISAADLQTLQRSSRWLVRDADRAHSLTLHDQLGSAFAHDQVRLDFADGSSVNVRPAARSWTSLPATFWLLAGFGLSLAVVGLVVLLSAPSPQTTAYAAMAFCQAGNLLIMAAEASVDFGIPEPFARLDMPVRMAFDLVTAAAMVNVVCLSPRRLPGTGWIALGAWAFVAGLVAVFCAGMLPDAWWWTQGSVIGLGLTAICLLTWSHQIEPHPFAIVLKRFTIITLATWALLSAACAAPGQLSGLAHNGADITSMVWYIFLGSVLLLAPFLVKSKNFLREFSLLAASTTVAASLNLLFVGTHSLDPFASLTLSLFISLAMYTGARHWIVSRLFGSSALTTERMFEQLYRIAREVEAHPERAAALLAQLLGEVFEPLEVTVVERRTAKARVAADGSSMLVPVPLIGGDDAPRGSVLIRFGQRGRHLFTVEDARLTDRIVEQLRRAVHFDKAVEQGRREERLRLAQDLHDDIGARLLTLMYKAQSPEMEDYLRHTLQDLKTLTRGLAASNHRLSHAAAEWKADLTHRLTAAQVELKWSFVFDDDILMTVGQWSALTRVLRELVSNAIAHAQAQRLEIDFRLESDRVDLLITDDGIGRSPRTWSHGLGLGGVRKRVKQLGGEVEWREVAPHGISCRVVIPALTARR
jgi:signal transduction histidine kinase